MLRICLIGSGRAGMIHAGNFQTKISGVALTTVVDPLDESLKIACDALAVKNGFKNYRQALQEGDFDAVIITAPTKYHKEIAVAAASAGKHILCEKPLAMTVEECDAIIECAHKNKVKLQVGFMRRFSRDFMAAKERVDSGEIGGVVMVRSLTYGPSTPQPWMYDISKSNGPLAEVNSHDIDTLRWFTGSEFKEIRAIAGNYRCPDVKKEFPDFYDNVLMDATFKNGMQGSISGAQGVRYGYDSRCEILGTKGIIMVGSLRRGAAVCFGPNGMSAPIVKSWMDLYSDAYLEEDRHFAECVRDDKQPKVSGFDGRQAVEVVNAGNRSIRENKIISI